MGSKSFHENKIREILSALQKSTGNLFPLCVGLFYLGVHLVDFHLAENGYENITNHGDRKNKLRKLDGNLFLAWDSLFSISNDQRYREITSEEHLVRLKEDVLEILSIVSISEEFKQEIENVVVNL